MSVIQTCVANLANPFDYLLAVVRHAKAVKAEPASWLPWNYKESLAAFQNPRPP